MLGKKLLVSVEFSSCDNGIVDGGQEAAVGIIAASVTVWAISRRDQLGQGGRCFATEIYVFSIIIAHYFNINNSETFQFYKCNMFMFFHLLS